MVPQPEEAARRVIDSLLAQAGWVVCDAAQANIHGARGIAIREFPLKSGHGFADYLLYVNGRAAGVIEAKPAGSTLTGVEIQSAKYSKGLPENLPAWGRPLPFSYQSTGTETRFTNGLDPAPRSHPVFAFHRPETLAAWLEDARITPSPLAGEGRGEGYLKAAETSADHRARGATFLARPQQMPALKEAGLWPAQIKAINNLEQSLKANRPRAPIQRGEPRVKEPRMPAHGCAGWASSGAGLRSEEGATLTGVEIQSDKYTKGLPKNLPSWHNPLPFTYQSTGAETRFTNSLDPQRRSRAIVHRSKRAMVQ